MADMAEAEEEEEEEKEEEEEDGAGDGTYPGGIKEKKEERRLLDW